MGVSKTNWRSRGAVIRAEDTAEPLPGLDVHGLIRLASAIDEAIVQAVGSGVSESESHFEGITQLFARKRLPPLLHNAHPGVEVLGARQLDSAPCGCDLVAVTVGVAEAG